MSITICDITRPLSQATEDEIAKNTWEKGNLYIETNPNSIYWKEDLHGLFTFTKWDYAWGYMKGIGGYLGSLIFRIIGLIVDTLALFIVWQPRLRLKLFGAALVENFSCIIGIVCPPLAYRIDEWVQKDNEVRARAFFDKWNKIG